MTRTEIKKKMIECLQKFDGVDAPDDKVSETLFTIYREEMNELCRMFEAEFRKLHQPTVSICSCDSNEGHIDQHKGVTRPYCSKCDEWASKN